MRVQRALCLGLLAGAGRVAEQPDMRALQLAHASEHGEWARLSFLLLYILLRPVRIRRTARTSGESTFVQQMHLATLPNTTSLATIVPLANILGTIAQSRAVTR